MGSGPKKRRAAKRKNEAKQNNDLTTVSVVKMTVPIEKLAKSAVWHEATSVDKELDKIKNTIGEVSKQTDVSVKLAKGADLNEVKNTNEDVSDNSNAIQENNEVPLLDVTSNEDILVSNDEPVLSKTACCIMENVESIGISQGNESCGVETEQLSSAPDQMFELLSDDLTPDEILERYHDLFFDNDITTLDYDVDRGFFFRDVPVVVPGDAIVDGLKDVPVMENVIVANEESLLNVTTNEDKEMSEDVTIVSQSSSCIVESVELCESDVAPEVKKDIVTLVSMNVVSNENSKMIDDQSTEADEGMKDAALPVVSSLPSSNELLMENVASAENIGLSHSIEMQALPTGTVPPATENQVYFACPRHCNAECSFSQLLRDQLLEKMEELKSAIHSLKEDLEKTLDKLDSISY